MLRRLVVVLVVIVLAACAPAAESVGETDAVEAEGETIVETVLVEAESGPRDEAVEEEKSDDAPASESGFSGEQSIPPQQERLIIKNGDMSLLVEDVPFALEQVTNVASQYGGYVVSSEISQPDDSADRGTIVIGVEVDGFENAMADLRDVGMNVLDESATGQDVTDEFVDLESRLRNLEATRDRVRTFLEEANDVEEALEVNRELSRLDEEIETIRGRMAYLQGRAAFSTIRVELTQFVPTPEPTPTPTPEPNRWSINETVNDAGRTQLQLVRGLAEALVWLVVVPGPYALVLGLVVLGVRQVIRRSGSI